jgi:TonB family protein
MKLFFASILTIYCFFCFSEDTIFLKKKSDTEPVPREQALFFKIEKKDSLNIESTLFYMNGVKINVTNYSSANPEILNGLFWSFFYNGKVNVQGNYVNNEMSGVWTVYNESGKVEEKSGFKNNKREGHTFTFYQNGKVKRNALYLRDTLVMSTCYDSIGVEIDCLQMDTIGVYEKVEVMPSFPGGTHELFSFLAHNIKYPPAAREKGLEGKVIVKFYVDVDGTVRNPDIIKNGTGSAEIEHEAIRVILSMPRWIPGIHAGNPVKVYYSLPITFKVQ